jgi:hypothetical protein
MAVGSRLAPTGAAAAVGFPLTAAAAAVDPAQAQAPERKPNILVIMGDDVGLPDQAVTLATVLKSLGYETGRRSPTCGRIHSNAPPRSVAKASTTWAAVT